MTRDWNLIRFLLALISDKPTLTGVIHPRDVAGYDAELVSYHLGILLQAGLIEGSTQGHPSPLTVARSLTWEGPELLDLLRSETVWNRVRTLAREKGLTLTLEAVKTLATVCSDTDCYDNHKTTTVAIEPEGTQPDGNRSYTPLHAPNSNEEGKPWRIPF